MYGPKYQSNTISNNWSHYLIITNSILSLQMYLKNAVENPLYFPASIVPPLNEIMRQCKETKYKRDDLVKI